MACRLKAPQQDLIRLRAEDSTGVLSPNPRQGTGRSAYICPTPECRSKLTPKALSRTLRRAIDQEELARLLTHPGFP
ncbi:MAG: YlxR family protein [Armatimonadetes bacterium]|nr:YlxR family protein [Armatimonadota bacterium]